MSNLIPFEQQRTLAKAFASSGLFGVKSEEQALALMALCEAEGMHPAKAIQRYHIVQGRPAMKAETMLAEFQKAGGKVDWEKYADDAVVGVFSHPQGGSVRIEWTLDKAKSAGLAGKDVWKNYARAMMRSRCISEGVRTVYPGVVEGVYTPEEIETMPTDPVLPIPAVDVSDWTNRINDAVSEAAARDLWKEAVEACRVAGDKEAHKTLGGVVAARIKALQASPAIEGEPSNG